MPEPERPQRIDATRARAGSREGVVRWVLLVSLTLTVLAFAAIVLTGALSQGPVESQMNVERKAEAQREAAATDDGSGAGDIAEEAGLVAPGTDEQAQSPAPAVKN